MNISKELENLRQTIVQQEATLSDPEVIRDPKRLREANEIYQRTKTAFEIGESSQKMAEQLEDLKKDLADSTDVEFRLLAQEEIEKLQTELPKLEDDFLDALQPPDPMDKKNIIVEIRAGTGGDEAALFAANLYRMYNRYAERQGWKSKLISSSQNDIGGFKEVTFGIKGENVYSHLKFESGVHRVQRVPETEKSGRVHTSTATVAILPEVEEVDIKLDPKDLNIQANTSQGAGGQSVNTTYSAIRITHIPTGIVVSCQDERSQQQNKDRALQILRARLFAFEQEKAQKERSETRRSQVGTGERSEKIRTYNYPQDRVTDHRLEENFHDLPAIMDGDIADMIENLKQKERELRLKN